MDHGNILEAGGFYFIHNFDSGNLGHVERVSTEYISPSLNHRSNTLETPDHEFNIWTRPDCYGTEFENGNRTWFYFGIQGGQPNSLVRLNIINLNKQGKMYSQGMAPVTRTLPGQPHWERIRDRPVHSTDDNTFTLSFKYRTPENHKATTFFAFTYPFSFTELQIALNAVDQKFLPLQPVQSQDDIYYCRENLICSLEGRKTDLLTISSYHGITNEREERLKNLFPESTERPFKFNNKKIIFISARVHPGETPSSFVFNGFLNLLLTRNDPIAIQLRKLYVFKLIPFLNPDGVARGHYRTDTRGVNLNRVYLNPSLELHPTVYAARALIRYHHFGYEKEDDLEDSKSLFQGYSRSIPSVSEETLTVPVIDLKKKKGQVTKGKESYKQTSSLSAKAANVGKLVVTRSQTTITTKTDTSKPAHGEKLAEQVCDMKLQDTSTSVSKQSSMASNATATSGGGQSRSLLDDVVVRDCLGSEVHLSRSDELSCITGPNPLRQLRDTLKNSISLLIGGNSYPGDQGELGSREPGWSACSNETTVFTVPSMSADDNDPSIVISPDNKSAVSETQSMFYTNCYKMKDASGLETSTVPVCSNTSGGDRAVGAPPSPEDPPADSNGDTAENKLKAGSKARRKPARPLSERRPREPESGLFLYVDLHGHASKKGIFMYGNHFDEAEQSVECMLLPRIMSLNNLHFHFSSCNFTERNMYLKDRRDGMSREGSGRVAVLKATGLIRSYTLECNYNTGRLVNVLPPALKDPPGPPGVNATPPAPPKYTPHIFEEVGRSLGSSILDVTGQHPNSRLPASEHRTLSSVREWLRSHTRTMRPAQFTMSRLRPKPTSPTRVPLYTRPLNKTKIIDLERKENTYIGAKPEEAKKPPARPSRPSELSVDRFPLAKTDKPFACRTRCFTETEPKPKNLSAKRRNVLAIRKPNAGKARSSGPSKSKGRLGSDEVAATTSIVASRSSKGTASFASRSFRQPGRVDSRARVPSAVASSSSEEVTGGWDEAGPPKRRPPAPPAPRRHKKIRLKTAS